MTNALTHTLLRNILDQPTAREPRLVFADQLDDRGDTLRADTATPVWADMAG